MVADYVEYCEQNELEQGRIPMPPKMSQYVNLVEKV
jgi:hypothetical protein